MQDSEQLKKVNLDRDDTSETLHAKSDAKDVAIESPVRYSKTDENVTIELEDKTVPGNSPMQKDLLLAATLVTDAKQGRHSDFITSDHCLRFYLMYHQNGLKYSLYFFIALHHFIAICEEPAVEGFQLPFWVTIGIEVSCIFFYAFRLMHCASFLPRERFWKDTKNLLVIAVSILTIVDIVCYIFLRVYNYDSFAYRWSRPLRPIFMINFSESKQIRRAFRNIRKTLPDILNVLILFLLLISLFALMGQKLFQNRPLKFPDGSSYFVNYFDIYFDLYVLVTSANYPDVMMPAYDSSRWFGLFFVTFLIICLYIFMNIFLAVVYNNYRKHLKNEVRKLVYMKRQSLARAFDLLKVKINGAFVLNYERFCLLLKMLRPPHSATMINVLWFVLDSDGDNKISKADFLQLADLLNVSVSEIKDRRNILQRLLPSFYGSKCSKGLRTAVAHRYFRYFFDVMILLNAILIAFDIGEAEWFFLGLFSLEVLLKMYTFGATVFFKRFWNIFDFIVIGAAVIATAVESFIDAQASDRIRTLDILLVLRVLRLVKIIGAIERFQVVVTTIMNLGPSILTYGGVLFVVFYMFAIVGMELFKYRIRYYGYENVNTANLFCGNDRLNGSAFYQSHYCSNNFNNLLNSFVVLFELLVVNQWHAITSGYILVTTKAARLYFFAFHLTCVIIVLNIFTAFVLEAFILEYSFHKSKLETAMEKKIIEMGLSLGVSSARSGTKTDADPLVENLEGDIIAGSDHDVVKESKEQHSNSEFPDLSKTTDIRFHLSKSKNVENLLQRMFENELDVEDTGPADVNDLDNDDDLKQHP